MSGTGVAVKAGSNVGEARSPGNFIIPSHRINMEVIDPQAARVVARLTMEDELLVGLLDSRRAAIYSEDSVGNPRLRIIRFRLAGR